MIGLFQKNGIFEGLGLRLTKGEKLLENNFHRLFL